MISVRTTWDQRRSLDVHLCQKDLKLVKKWLGYGYFPNERLCDFKENRMGPKGIFGCSFVQKRFKIGQEMAELCYFPTERLRDFNENHMGPKGIFGFSFVPKRSKIGQEMAELWLFSH